MRKTNRRVTLHWRDPAVLVSEGSSFRKREDRLPMDEVVKEIFGDTPLGAATPFSVDDAETLLAQRPAPQRSKPRNRHVISLVWLLFVRLLDLKRNSFLQNPMNRLFAHSSPFGGF
jgi:hypothetical protein